jgi:hypothetical protein
VTEGLTSIGIVPPSVDVGLQVLTVCELSLVLFLLLLVPLLLGLVKVGEISFPVVESLRVLVDDVGRHSVEERSIVRSAHQ